MNWSLRIFCCLGRSRIVFAVMNNMVRKHINFHGWVQGVGFRYHARHAAELYGCTGWVRNEWDGSVTMEMPRLLRAAFGVAPPVPPLVTGIGVAMPAWNMR